MPISVRELNGLVPNNYVGSRRGWCDGIDLSVANKQKLRLTMRRIAFLIETDDAAAMDLIDKLCKIKPAKATA